MDIEIEPGDMRLLKFENYLDYVNSFVYKKDKRFLQSERLERIIVKLGYRSTKPIYTEDEFWGRRTQILEMITGLAEVNTILTAPLQTSDPVLMAFYDREEPTALKCLATIVHIRHTDQSGFEISSYIDLGESFQDFRTHKENCWNWVDIYESRAKLLPRSEDLSYVDVHGKVITYNDTANFKVIHTDVGIAFMHRGDHKIIPVGPNVKEHAKNVVRSFEMSEEYGFVVFYDHKVRKMV